MSTVDLPGGRNARASLDGPGGDAVVVACPPHPLRGGTRHDARLRAVRDALAAAGTDCLRVGYGPWDEGRGARTDVRTGVDWAADRYDRVGLFGYSFGGGVVLAVAAGDGSPLAAASTPDAVATLAPVPSLPDDTDVAAAVRRLDPPLWVGHGTRDRTVDVTPVIDAARDRGATVASFDAGHGFAGRTAEAAERVARFLAP